MKAQFTFSFISSLRGAFAGIVILFFALNVSAASQTAPVSIDAYWDEGSIDCAKTMHVPLQVHAYNPRTFVLRENLCSTFEAPFMYLLIGSSKAMLIDTGDIADPAKMPLATTVLGLLPGVPGGKMPLLVVHTHRHLDHRAGDSQFSMPNVQIVGFDLDSVRGFYGFTNWPNGVAQIDLGERTVDVIPTPGHNETEVSFYDRNTALFFSGDFFLPARFLIDDTKAYLASAERVAAFFKDRPVTHVLGGHIEENRAGQLYDWQSTYHPQEHSLQISRADLLTLAAAIRKFNGFYTQSGDFVLMNSIRILLVSGVTIVVLLMALVFSVVRWLRCRRRRKGSVLAA